VTCSDCHEPHDLSLRAPGNGVCLQCHQADRFDTPAHHFHEAGTAGASCAECHMPPRNYMVVDPRHDHSMHIPRPDLSVKLGTPNACNTCHQDRSSEWAAQQVSDWYEKTPTGLQQYAAALQAARDRAPTAGRELAALIRNTQMPDIARATALAAMGPYVNRANAHVLASGVADGDPMVRAATLTALEALPQGLQVRLAWPLLSDPVRAVRIAAARLLSAIPTGELAGDQRERLDSVMGEYVDSQLAMAERPEAQANLGNFYFARGEGDKAVAAYRTASMLEPLFVPARINLADFYSRSGDEAQAEAVLREGITEHPSNGDLQHALGLSLIRQKRFSEAVAALQRGSGLSPGNPRYVYVYAVALNSTGQAQQAIMVLQGAHNAHPNDRDILSALVAFNRDAGNDKQAARYARKLKLFEQ